MAIVICSREDGTGLTPEEMRMLEEAEKLPQVYDDDCPKLTSEQLAEFRPVYYASMEERAEAMRMGTANKKVDVVEALSL